MATTDVLRLLEAAVLCNGIVRPLAVDGWVFTTDPHHGPIAVQLPHPIPKNRSDD